MFFFVPFVWAIEEFHRDKCLAVGGEDPTVFFGFGEVGTFEVNAEFSGVVGTEGAFSYTWNALEDEDVFLLNAPVGVLRSTTAGVFGDGIDLADGFGGWVIEEHAADAVLA